MRLTRGDTVYIGPGVYREVNTLALTNPAAETKILGDPFGIFTGDAPGEVVFTAYLTNDTTAASTTPLLTFAQRDNITMEDLRLIGGANTTVSGCVVIPSIGGTSENLKFNRIIFECGSAGGGTMQRCVDYHVGPDVTTNTVFNDCVFVGRPGPNNGLLNVQFVSTGATTSYDANIQVNNSLFLGRAVNLGLDGSASTFFGNGVKCNGCTAWGTAIGCGTASVNTVAPSTWSNGFVYSGGEGPGFTATTSGQIAEDHNYVVATTPRTNVSAGTGSVSDGSFSPMFEVAPFRGFPQRQALRASRWITTPLAHNVERAKHRDAWSAASSRRRISRRWRRCAHACQHCGPQHRGS